MSIATNKFLSMLNEEISKDRGIDESQKATLMKLCRAIYLLETTAESTQIPSSIKEEIKRYAKEYEVNL